MVLSISARDRGAVVTRFDASAKMLELASARLGDDADLHLAVLGDPLPAPEAHELFPEEVKEPGSAFLCFLFFVLHAE